MRGNSRLLLAIGLALATGLALPAAPAKAGFEEGVAALQAGDFARAKAEFEPLAEAGDGAAQYNLGTIYRFGQGAPKDYALARDWLGKSAAQKYPAAMRALGDMAARGEGLEAGPDLAQAADWYRQAAAEGDPVAMTNLGSMAQRGEGMAQDPAVAVQWWTQAAETGYAPAQYDLGLAYATGEGTAMDLKLAYLWFRLAANRGDEDALAAIDAISPALAPEDIDAAEAAAKAWKPKS